MEPTVSVVIPVYSRAGTIMRALRSVMCQSFNNLEIVVVDDGSTDETVAIVEAAHISNLTLIRHSWNQGAAAARNTGIRAARGRYVAFLDSDDVWAPEKLSRQLSKLEHMPADIMACTSGYCLHRHGASVSVPNDLSPGQFRQQILLWLLDLAGHHPRGRPAGL